MALLRLKNHAGHEFAIDDKSIYGVTPRTFGDENTPPTCNLLAHNSSLVMTGTLDEVIDQINNADDATKPAKENARPRSS